MTSTKDILPDNIRSILSKYYEGLTSIEEERLLKEYFGNQQIPESNFADKTVLSFKHNDEISMIPQSVLWAKIKSSERREAKRRHNIRLISSIAASIVLLFSIGIGYNIFSSRHKMLASDTYNNPEEAYKAVQKYLGLVSTKLSYAYTGMKPMEKLAIPSETMQSFLQIDYSIQKLNQLGKFDSATQEMAHLSVLSDFIVVDNN